MTDRTKCKRVTKKGTPCPYTAITGSEFCRRHQPREIWIPLLFSIVLNILLFIVSVAISLYCYGESKSWRHISRPRVIPAVGGFPVVIDDGLNVIINKPGFVTHKMEEGPFEDMDE